MSKSRKNTPRRAKTEPTDNSIPPVMMTSPTPIEIRPKSPIWLARFIRFTCDRNCGLIAAVTAPTARINNKRPSSFLSMGVQFLCRIADGKHQDIVLRKLRPLEKAADPALVHDGNPVADPDHFLHVARYHQDRDPGIRKLAHERVDFVLGADIYPAGRFVEHDQPRPHREPLGQHHLLL